MEERPTRPHRLVITCAGSAALLLVVLSGLPDWFKLGKRGATLTFNPWSTGAMIDELASAAEKSRPDTALDWAYLRNMATTFTTRAPLNADLKALEANMALRNGDVAQAKRQLRRALILDRTNVLAVRSRTIIAINERNFKVAVAHLDPLFRRNPAWISDFQPEISELLQSIEGRKAMAHQLAQSSPWFERFFHETAKDEANLDGLSQLVLALGKKGTPSSNTLAVFLMRSLLKRKRYAEAHRLFLFAKSGSVQNQRGYIVNTNFAAKPSNHPFGWNIKSSPTASVRWQNGQIDIGFRDMRLRFPNVRQHIYLPTGRYKLGVDQSANALFTKRRLRWSISCISPPAQIATVSIDHGTYNRSHSAIEFDVKESGCAMHTIRLTADRARKHQRERNKGFLSIHGFSLSRVSPAKNG